ncbi:hypothetical protein DFJ74DRAFT_686302 [Hyaloraphidium curvatum]|nr:hypothetical protein DFJ74DRAFT_686302 [Hyaloraphidium curvatum]
MELPQPGAPWASSRPAQDVLSRAPSPSHPHYGAAMLAGSSAIPGVDAAQAAMDRMACVNVLSAYKFYVDENAYEAFRDQCFWPEAEMSFLLPDGEDRVGFSSGGPFDPDMKRVRHRHDFFRAHRMQRRHFEGATTFLEQSADRIRLVQQGIVFNINSQRPPVDVVTPVIGDAIFEKRDGVWKLLRWHYACDTIADGGTEPKNLNPRMTNPAGSDQPGDGKQA